MFPSETILCDHLSVMWIRKPIRRLHLRVYPDGSVVVSSPWFCPEDEVRQFVRNNLNWIMRTRQRVQSQPPRTALPNISREQTEELLLFLKDRVEYWRLQMNESPVTWKVRNMRTQWGNCRPQTRRLTFNLQLARVPVHLRDYIIVHELSHLQVPNHSALFYARMALFIPDWKSCRQLLKTYIS